MHFKTELLRPCSPAAPSRFLPALISPEVADAFLRLLWTDIGAKRVPVQRELQPVLVKRALEIHGRNYTPLLGLHWGLTSLISQQVDADLLPSFAWFRLYFQDDRLRVHADRLACEFSVSLTLGYSDNQPWPLGVGTERVDDLTTLADDFGSEPHDLYEMGAGDAVLYDGSHYRHGRTVPNPNRWSAHLFLQWVSRGGPHEQEAFERLDLGARPD